MKLKNSSAKALAWFSGILTVIGWCVMSPSGAVFCFALSAMCAAIPGIFGTGRMRFAAGVLLIVGIVSVANRYPDFRGERERFGAGRGKAAQQTIKRN